MPTLLNYVHSFKFIGIIMLFTVGFSVLFLVYKLLKKQMHWILGRFARFFAFKILQVLLMEMFLFLLINVTYEFQAPVSNGGYTVFSASCLILIFVFYFSMPINLLLNTCVWKTPP